MAKDALVKLEARLPAEAHATLKRAAELQGRTLTDFVFSAAHEAARRTIADTGLTHLVLQDEQKLAQAIFKSPAPKQALRRAFQRRKALLAAR